ncbi:putative Calcium-binding protein [Diplonema papillatum]|nr:putative Calcium-binding protein [Diplonema papillatum]
MVFTLFVATDVRGVHVNIELNFPHVPNLDEVRNVAEKEFESQGYHLPPGRKTLQVNDSGHLQEPVAQADLKEYCQLFMATIQENTSGPQGISNSYTVKATPAASWYGHGSASPIVTPPDQREGFQNLAAQRQTYGLGRGGALSRGIPRAHNRLSTPRLCVERGPGSLADAGHKRDEMAEFVFSEITAGQNIASTSRVIDRELFLCIFQRHFGNGPLSRDSGSISDVFAKCDENKDGVLDKREFVQVFGAKKYPTLLESLYRRMQHDKATQKSQAALAQQREALSELEAKRLAAQEQHQATVQQALDLNNKLNAQTNCLSASRAREQDTRKALERAQLDAGNSRGQLHVHMEHCQALEEDEGARLTTVTDLGSRIAKQQFVANKASKDAQCESDKLEELRKLLDEQQALVHRMQAEADQAQQDLRSMRDNFVSAEEAVSAVRNEQFAAKKAIDDLEAVVALRVEAEHEAATSHRNAVNEVAREQAKRDLLERELNSVHESEAVVRAQDVDTQRAEEAASAKLVDMQTDVHEAQSRFEALDSEEQRMLQQEVELQCRKDEIEQTETALRSQHRQLSVRFADQAVEYRY